MTARSYDLEAMRVFIELLDAAIASITDHGAQIGSVGANLLSQFGGATADSFSDRHSLWITKTDALVTELRAVRDQIATARTNYLEAEEANRLMRA
ncbi:WXG100 family type VII secretion target [Nocardia takedensis]